MYGDCFLDGQYLPYALELIAAARTKMSTTAEAALLGISTLLERIFTEIPDPVLMAQLKVWVDLNYNVCYTFCVGFLALII